MTTNDLVELLQPVVAGATGDLDVDVSDLQRLSGGASRETWSFIAVGSDGSRRPLILQRDGSSEMGSSSGMGVEAAAIDAAHAAGVPVPKLLASSDSIDPLGAPFLLSEHVDGETIARKIQRDERYALARSRFATDAGHAVAKIHTVDPAQVPGLEDVDQIARYREVLDELGAPHPTFELAFRWLERNRPPSTGTTLVHGDFRLGNVIVADDHLAAVIDWELAHIGDPAEDLGWICVKAWRFGGPEPVGGLGSYVDLLAAYEDAGGHRIDLETLRWWETLGTLKWGIICIMQAHGHLTRERRSHELAAIGRRVCENELDLLELLAR
ncbi:MAG: phosphotransferase family protein [Actinomycetota bacterium]